METSRERTLTPAEKVAQATTDLTIQVSSTHSTIWKRKAQLEATKTKAKYAEQAEILRRKLELDAGLIQIKHQEKIKPLS
jgi:propanediol dehydratase large subunit